MLWASAGRSAATAERAAAAGLEDAGTLEALVGDSDVIVSVCPPHGARDLARTVVGAGFGGTYVDANAVSPDAAREVAEIVTAAGASYVDGGIIGPPAHRAGTTRLYLSGPGAHGVAALFEGSLVDARAVDERPTSASALKMAYAAWTKGSAALLIAVRAMARAEGVEPALLEEWGLSQAGLEARSDGACRANALKAWRFVGEMNEIAHTFREAGITGAFHDGAADVYERMSPFKDAAGEIDPDDVLAHVMGSGPSERAAGG